MPRISAKVQRPAWKYKKMITIDPTAPSTTDSSAVADYTVDEVAAQASEELMSDPTGRWEGVFGSDLSAIEPRVGRVPGEALAALIGYRNGNGHHGGAVGTTSAERIAALSDISEVTAAGGRAIPFGPIVPIPPIVIKRMVSGRYLGTTPGWRLELRTDVDGARPMKRVSGDYYQITGGTVSYFGSFVIDAITLAVTSTTVTITGIASATWVTSFNRVKVTIPRVSFFNPPAAATIRWFNAAGSPGAMYTCSYASRFLRSVSLEQDSEFGITPFASYNTGSLPSGGPARNLTVAGAYAEAGIEVATAGIPTIIGAAPGSSWDNSELHHAMVTHFSLWQDIPQWKAWLFHASRHTNPGVLGIMFDQQGQQRQGCATFYNHPLMNGNTATHLRTQLYCGVHELGHAFNLFHSFHKQFMTPPLPNRPGALSWMNYPQNYAPPGGPGGEAAFWSAFPFQFDESELIHLRHAFRNNVIMGGNPFGTGAALEALAEFDQPVEDNSGLKLELRTDRVFKLGEPVFVEIKLSLAGGSRQVHPHLHPDATFVRIAVQKPGGAVIIHEPVLEQCVAVETTRLTADRPALYESAYIGYGKDGLLFDQPGIYRIRALYAALDGSQVVSSTLQITVRAPLTEEDADVAELLIGEDQGMLFYLMGSDSEYLASGNSALKEVEEKHSAHPLAIYSRLLSGWSQARPFKSIETDGKVTLRKANPDQAAKLLGSVTDATTKGRGVDNITLGKTLCRLARSHSEAGDDKAAGDTVKKIKACFKAKNLQPYILNAIDAEANAALDNKD